MGIRDRVVLSTQTDLSGADAAVKAAVPLLQKVETIMVLNGDTPLVKAKTLAHMADVFEGGEMGALVLGVNVPNPTGYGRIIRAEDGAFEKIVEETDADEDTKKISEINSGMYVFNSKALQAALIQLTPQGPKQEYYLTDTLALIKEMQKPVLVFAGPDYREALGVNSKAQLAEAEQIMRNRVASE